MSHIIGNARKAWTEVADRNQASFSRASRLIEASNISGKEAVFRLSHEEDSSLVPNARVDITRLNFDVSDLLETFRVGVETAEERLKRPARVALTFFATEGGVEQRHIERLLSYRISRDYSATDEIEFKGRYCEDWPILAGGGLIRAMNAQLRVPLVSRRLHRLEAGLTRIEQAAADGALNPGIPQALTELDERQGVPTITAGGL